MDLQFPISAGELAARYGGKLIGDAQCQIHAISGLEEAKSGDLAFYQQRALSTTVQGLRDSVLLTTAELVEPSLPLTFIVVDNPQLVFSQVASVMSWYPENQGIHPTAIVEDGVQLGEGVGIGAGAIVQSGAVIGDRTHIMARSYVGANVTLGQDCHVFPNVTLLEGVEIGNRVKIYPGTVIGSDGFGFIETKQGLKEMPQVGTVVVEDDVRVGALVTIDRATLGETRVGTGTKIDDHVHIAHNCQIGKHCVLCGAVGLAGSVVLEDFVVLGGQVGLGDHVHVGKGAKIGSQGGTTTNVKGGISYWGTPAIPVKESLKLFKFMRKLPEMWQRLVRLEKRVGEG